MPWIPLLLLDENDNTFTGRYEGAITSGPGSGAWGMLLTQTGSTVAGSLSGWPIIDGTVSGDELIATVQPDDDSEPILLSFTQETNGDLTGTISHGSTSIPLVMNKYSSSPINPNTGQPQVLDASCNGSAINVTWDRAVRGWDFTIEDTTSNTSYDGYLYADRPNFSYDADGYIFHLALLPSMVFQSGNLYLISLDDGDSVDWTDAYGTPAWDSPASCEDFYYTAP